MMTNDHISIRRAQEDDVEALSALLNEIIEIGGTTANQMLMDPDGFVEKYLAGVETISCFAAVDGDGHLAGFQHLSLNVRLPGGWVDIATFARVANKVRGVGSALFAATKTLAQDKGFDAINATIRADNVGGLAFYSKMGFQDYHVDHAIPLLDGTPVDRISKKFLL